MNNSTYSFPTRRLHRDKACLISISTITKTLLCFLLGFMRFHAATAQNPTLTTTNTTICNGASVDLNSLITTNGTTVTWSENPQATAIEAGFGHSLALLSNGTVVGWGSNVYGQRTFPAFTASPTAIAAGNFYSLALLSNGTVVGWGNNSYGETTSPAFAASPTAIAAGRYHSLALLSNGTVVGWGNNADGQTSIPAFAASPTAIAAGGGHSLALLSNGTVVGWGWNFYGQRTIPAFAATPTAIAAGSNHSLALLSNGTVVGWGDNVYGERTIPAFAATPTAIAAGDDHSLVLLSNGSVVGWGNNDYGQTNIPAFTATPTAISASNNHGLALLSNGTVVGWGSNTYGESNGYNAGPLSNTTVSPTSTKTYYVVVRNANGSKSTGSVTVTIACPTWTGATSNNWHTASNWENGRVRLSTDAVTIPSTTNKPTISAAAVAGTVTLNGGAILTVAAAVTLTITGGANNYGLYNGGTVHNNGTLNINLTAISRTQGLVNGGTFNNNTGGHLNIDRSTDRAIDNYGTVFNNAGTITIGALASVGTYGLINQTIFNNNAGGIIKIDRVTTLGIYNLGGTFTNTSCSVINILSNSVINNTATFNNAGNITENASGNSSISSNTGTVQNLNGGTFTIGSGNAAVTTTGVSWTGCTSTDWNTASNWSTGSVPLSTENVSIQDVANKPILAANQTLNNLTLMGTNKISLGNYNLTVNTLTGGSPTAYIVTDGTGSLTINNIGTSATLFPVGTSTTNYTPVTITNNVNRNFTVRVGTAITNPISGTKYVNLQWDITPSVLTGNTATLAFGWSSTNQAVGFNPASAVQVNHYNGTTWDISTSATVSGSDPYTATASGISSFSPFAVSNVVVLPVELLDFSGKYISPFEGNLLTWQTAEEKNVRDFDIERSINGQYFTKIGTTKATGSYSTYTFTDDYRLSSVAFYRLKINDLDGRINFSKIISIESKGKSKLKIYPSVTSDFLTIETTDVIARNEAIYYQVFNLLGQQVLSSKTHPSGVGALMFLLWHKAHTS